MASSLTSYQNPPNSNQSANKSANKSTNQNTINEYQCFGCGQVNLYFDF